MGDCAEKNRANATTLASERLEFTFHMNWIAWKFCCVGSAKLLIRLARYCGSCPLSRGTSGVALSPPLPWQLSHLESSAGASGSDAALAVAPANVQNSVVARKTALRDQEPGKKPFEYLMITFPHSMCHRGQLPNLLQDGW